jgi:L-cystine transport system permease protein
VGFAIGALLAKAKMSKSRIACALAKFYTTIVRCTPSVVLLFIVYFGLPTLMSDKVERWMNNLPIVVFVCITFSIFIGASSSEIIRAAFESVNKGQREAGLSVGLSETQTFFHIILPQMFRQSIPNIGNTIIFLFKEGALAYTIGLRDVLGQAYFLSAKEVNVYALDMYIALTLIYWPITMILEKLFKWLEIYFTPVRKKAKEEEETIKGGVRA